MSDENIEKLMGGISIQRFGDRDAQEVRDIYELLYTVFTAWKTLKLSESAILHFHRELLKYVETDARHRVVYKKKENQVHMVNEQGKSIAVVFETTKTWLTPKEMQELVEWTSSALEEKVYHPILIIGNFLVEFLNIHPFEDGNRRLSRMLKNLFLL